MRLVRNWVVLALSTILVVSFGCKVRDYDQCVTCPTSTSATTCPSGQVGTPPNCSIPTPPPTPTCPPGQVGTPPNCTIPAPTPAQAPSLTVNIVGPETVPVGEEHRINWTSANCASVSRSGGPGTNWNGPTTHSGNDPIKVDKDTTITFTCVGLNGSVLNKSVTLKVSNSSPGPSPSPSPSPGPSPTPGPSPGPGINISVQPSTQVCTPGQSVSFTATVTGTSNTGVSWSSNSPSIAALSSTSGNTATFTCVSAGNTGVRATANVNGAAAFGTIGVNSSVTPAACTGLSFSGPPGATYSKASLGGGSTPSLAATYTVPAGCEAQFQSSNPNFVDVTPPTGGGARVYFLNPGTASVCLRGVRSGAGFQSCQSYTTAP